MKKALLTTLITGSSILGYSQFTPGNLAVLQANATTNPPTAGPAPTVSLVEFTRSGGSTAQRIDFPSTGAGRVVLANGTGSSTFEGFLKLSADFNLLTFGGYNAEAGTMNLQTSAATNFPRLAVMINKEKQVTMHPTTATSTKYIRYVAAKDNKEVWVGGNTTFMRYLNLPALGGAGGTSVSGEISTTSAGIFYGKLYFIEGKTLKGFTDLPASTSSEPVTLISGIANNPTDFVLFDTDAVAGPDLAYIGTDGTSSANLYKYKLEADTWVAKGSTSAPASITSNNRKVQGITGFKRGDGKYEIYYSTFSNILSFVDQALPSENLSISPNPSTPEITGEPSIIATAPANSIFRGLAFTPGSTPSVLPVELKSFTGKAEAEAIRLDWSTASEKNNSYFEVLRSSSGNPSETIGKIQGNGNSSALSNYSFTDINPFAGINYYQLKQVDVNGDSEKSKIIAVKSNLKETDLSVINGDGEEILLRIFSANSAPASIYIADMLGNKLAEVKVALEKGTNRISINVPGIKSGVYIATLNSSGKKIAVKFVK